METRPDWERSLLTLTVDPGRFGAVVVGRAGWNRDGSAWDGHGEPHRWSQLWSEPSPEQFGQAARSMSREWSRLRSRLAKLGNGWEHFRVVELHRNGWPHYHVVLEHPTLGAGAIGLAVAGWNLGISDVRGVSLHDAVGEVAPYLTSAESKGGGSKAYQFAAFALPDGFRLVSASRHFLGEEEPDDSPVPEYALAVRGHFTSHAESVRAWGGTTVLQLPPPDVGRLPAAAIATGDAAVVYFAELVDQAGRAAP